MHARIGETYWVRHASDSTEWALVPASYWGVVVDPPEPRNLAGAVFTTREKAEAYRAAAKPGTAGARARHGCRRDRGARPGRRPGRR